MHIRGNAKSGTTAWGTVVFTLPVDYRPKKDMFCFVWTGDYEVGGVIIKANGEVQIRKNIKSSWICFDNIIFRTN